MNNQNRKAMEGVYKNTPLEQIPWNNVEPPELIVGLVESGRIEPCRAVDLGCGAGNYAIYLASKGFDVTGVDFSRAAIKIAKKNAKKKGVKCEFVTADVINEMDKVRGGCDFAYDWGLLHHIMPEDRQKYVSNVHGLLNPGGKYLSLCFHEDDSYFEGDGKLRGSALGTKIYFSNKDELVELFSPMFEILDFQIIELVAKFGPHIFNYCFMRKK